jgi:hypothetical protein
LNARIIRYTYDSNDPAHPRRALVVQHPNSMTEVSLNDDRNQCGHQGNVYAGEMRVREAFHISKSGNQPIVDIGPSEHSLSSLQREDEISCTNLALTSQIFRMIPKTDLKVLRLVCHLGNCSYTRLNLGEWNKMRFRGQDSYRFERRGRHRGPS